MGKKICFCIFLFFLILNIVVDLNIKNYIQTLEKCFGKSINITNNLYVLICFIFALISIFIILDILLVLFLKQKENKGINFKTEDGTYGTSNWMPEKEIEQVLGINDIPGIILGKYNENIVKLPLESYFNKNICVFGSSRKYENNRIFINELAGAFKI